MAPRYKRRYIIIKEKSKFRVHKWELVNKLIKSTKNKRNNGDLQRSRGPNKKMDPKLAKIFTELFYRYLDGEDIPEKRRLENEYPLTRQQIRLRELSSMEKNRTPRNRTTSWFPCNTVLS